MAQAVGITRPHFNAYHHSNSLLFQFIMSEFLTASHELQKINQLIAELKLFSKRGPRDFSGRDRQIQMLVAGFTQLAGSTHEYMRIFAWNGDNGILVKLKNYSDYLAQNCDKEDKLFSSLERHARRAWMLCLQILDAIRDIQNHNRERTKTARDKPSEEDGFFEGVYILVDKLSGSLKKFSRNLAKCIPQFRDDENVVYFVLDHSAQFDGAYGRCFAAKLLAKMFPNGLQEAGWFLKNKYALRGFHQLAPVIAHKIAMLKPSLP